MPPPPTPFHLLRAHHSPLSALHFNPSNTLLYSGDQDGYISILDLRVRRVVAYWQAHEGGVLGLEEWEGGLISHGRDNLIHFYQPLKRPYVSFGLSTNAKSSKPGLELKRSLPTNALNFCRFSITAIPSNVADGEKGKGKEKEAIMAVPSLTDSELIDIYHIPSLRRIHASVNLTPKTQEQIAASSSDPTRSGLVMSLHIVYLPDSSRLALAAGYEDGRVELFAAPLSATSTNWDARMSSGPKVWERLWVEKGHNEAVMGMAVDKGMKWGWSVSADHRLVRYDFGKVLDAGTGLGNDDVMRAHSTKQIGNSSIAVAPDGRVVAVGGWDGKIRLFSAATTKPLGTLSTHRDTVHVVTFANSRPAPVLSIEGEGKDDDEISKEIASTLEIGDGDDTINSDEEEEDEEMDGVPPKERWFASGGKDTKVALWGLMEFAAGSASG
ncbi:hypothetical protein CI109_103237 [Kwoniella shandongensis]|uniref:ASTRA-associated protein 1 n=1 Tax=Kwoniella shandongensis TaxID=1734106 RepID=A0A5M6C911_9TREE|nr:uncharacterized protein CI109_000427 [Kwoniella shandongensis]KAA5531584.1 hypothetical protein CI109_000427 [Kwoniella shandongensis]